MGAGNPDPGEIMVAWVVFFITGPLVLTGYLGYLCRGWRERRMTKQEVRDLQVLCDTERREGLS
jgi:hypothetical protein